MAAPTESGYGLGVTEDAKTVDIDDVKRQGPKVVTGLAGEGGEGEEKDGTDAGGDESHGEEQVAKKARVEKVENGAGEKVGDGVVDKDGGEEVLNGGVNGSAGEAEEGGEEVENGVVGAGEEEAGVTGKDVVAPGDGGLKDLLQEGDDTKTVVANHGADATHMLNGAK